MKKKPIFRKNHSMKLIIQLFLSLFLVVSCTVQKRMHQPGYHVEWHSKNSSKQQVNNDIQPKIKHTEKATVEQNGDLSSETVSKKIELTEPVDIASSSEDFFEEKNQVNRTPIYTVNYSKEKCDTIIMKDGERIIAQVISASSELISFQKCGDTEKKVYKMDASNVLIIKYFNDRAEVFGSTKDVEKMNISYKQTEILSVLSLILSILAILTTLFLSVFAGGVLSVITLIFGIVGYRKVNRNKDKYKGKGLAIVGIILSVAGIVLAIISINILLTLLSS